jgi:hypothetical protein
MIKSLVLIFFGGLLLKVLVNFKGATKEQIDYNDLIQKYRTFDIKMLVSFFTLIPINIVALTYLLTQLSKIGFSTVPNLVYTIRPNAGTWFVISLILSMATSFVLIIVLVKRIKKEEESEYWKYYNLKYGLNAAWILKYLSIIIILFMTILTISQMNTYVKIYENEMTINKSLELAERNYELGDITGIVHYLKTTAPNGKIGIDPHYGIELNDGFIWRTNDDLRTPNINDDKIFEWLINRTKLELNEVEIDKN